MRSKLFVLVILAGIICSITFVGGQEASATTYNEIMKRATTEEKPAGAKEEEENPVLVNYEVGDTSNFYTNKDMKSASTDEESEWDSWDSEGGKQK